MKNNRIIKIFIAFALCVMSFSSCVREPDKFNLKSEVTIPNGAVNYFESGMDFNFEGGTKTLAFNCNLRWSVKVAETQNGLQWLTVTPSAGNRGNQKVTVIAEPNETYEDRSVVVQLITEDTTRNVVVCQKRMEAITLTSDKQTVSVEGGEIEIEVNHSTDYTVTIPDEYKSWIHHATNSTRGMVSSKLTFIIDPSEEYDKREGKIYFHARDEEEVVTVYQAGSGKLVLSQNEYNLTGAEQEFAVDISSNFDFAMEMPDVDWLQQNTSQTRGMSSHTLLFKVTKNDDYKARSAKIRVYDQNSKLSETIVVNQASIGAVLILDTLEYNVGSDQQDLDIEVKSNFDYKIDFQGANWVKQRKTTTRGITSRLLSLTVDKNNSYDNRTAQIKLYEKDGNTSEIITINQKAKDGIVIPTKEYTIDEVGGVINIDINSNVDYQLTTNDDWITVPTITRGLTTQTHSIEIAPLGVGKENRTGTITVSNEAMGFNATITVKQRQMFYLSKTEANIVIGRESKLTVTNLTGQTYSWKSNAPKIATIQNGVIKGVSYGDANITATTEDGRHIATCTVHVREITDLIKVSSSGGFVSVSDNLVQNGSKLTWTFENGSEEKVYLKTIQLVDGVTQDASSEMAVEKTIAAGGSESITTTISSSGIHLPVTCRFKFTFNGQEYIKEAVYDKSL